jgi:tRNA pseudouridine38-40 synthase
LQKHARTIQGELEKALQAIMGRPASARPIRVIPAGRTDAGVHARGQVVHLRAHWRHGMDDLRRAWNALLPGDIAIRAVSAVSPGFHARFSARSRIYRYRFNNGPVRSPLLDRYAWHVRQHLDAERMDLACAGLVGRRDLASLGPAPWGENTVRTVFAARCWAEGEIVSVEVEADAFLQHMMRRLAAQLMAVGLGRLTAEESEEIIRACDLSRAVGLAPPHGLCLVAVRYEPDAVDWALPTSELWQKESCWE